VNRSQHRQSASFLSVTPSSIHAARAVLAHVLHVVSANKSSSAPSGANKFARPAGGLKDA
jgi:hypothetical protein